EQVRQHRLDRVEGPLEVDRDHPVPVGLARLHERPAVDDPGVGHHDVDPAERLDQPVARGAHGRPVGHVGRQRDGPRAGGAELVEQRRRQRRLLGVGEVIDPDAGALAGQGQRDLAPDPPAGAGHQRDLPRDPPPARHAGPIATACGRLGPRGAWQGAVQLTAMRRSPRLALVGADPLGWSLEPTGTKSYVAGSGTGVTARRRTVSRYSRTSASGRTSPYFMWMSNRVTLWEVGPRSQTASTGTITRKLWLKASSTVSRTQPLVTVPVTTT